MHKANHLLFTVIFTIKLLDLNAQQADFEMDRSAALSVFLKPNESSAGRSAWYIQKADKAGAGEVISSVTYQPNGWLPAIVPGAVLNSLVHNKIYPEPYYGDNNRRTRN